MLVIVSASHAMPDPSDRSASRTRSMLFFERVGVEVAVQVGMRLPLVDIEEPHALRPVVTIHPLDPGDVA
jgi:hypothetical protein